MLGKSWRFIDTGISNGFLNMAVDEAMLDAHLKDFVPPTLRVYRWSPPALSIGYFQSLEEDVLQQRCSQMGIDIVRRITGGRSVFHHDELTYSVVASERYGLPKSTAHSYKLLNEGLIAAYGILGLEVCLVPSEKWLSSAACFSSAGLADLTFEGRKIAGSAQFRKGDTLLQHGSLPISLDAQLYLSLLRFPAESGRVKVSTAFSKKATSISEILGSQIGWQELKNALFTGFQKGLGIELHEETLTPEEHDLSQKLAREKYSTLLWNYYGRDNSERAQSAIPEAASLVP